MDSADKELLILQRPQLVDNIDITNGLMTHLLSRKVLNQRMVQSITYNKPPDRQIEELLDLLPKRGANAFKLFCEALVATDQEDVVSNFLQKKTDGETATLSSSSSSVTTASVPASPLSLVGGETSEAALTFTAPPSLSGALASLPPSAPPSTSLTTSVQESLTDTPSLNPSLLASPSKVSQKRKPETASAGCLESKDNAHFGSLSETDSSPLKRVRPDSRSVICINENVIKIYDPLLDEKGDNAVSKSSAVQESETFPKTFPTFLPQGGAAPNLGGSKAEEIRHVMKHFILKDSADDRGQEDHINMAASLLSNLPQEYLRLVSGTHMPSSKMRREDDFGSNIMRERLSRCDSTDTMETKQPENLRLDVSRKPAEVDQPDQSTVSIENVVSTLPVGQAAGKPFDCTDGHISVHVEECSRQFYNQFKDKSYRMLGMPRGQALIVNVNEVAEKPPRRGTDIDRDNLTNLLTQLHFQVTAYNDNDDLTAQGIAEKLRDFANKPEHESADACIICLLSHGEEGYMFGTDGKKIPLDEVFLLFDNRRCPALLNKPKVFFIQACRGGMLDQGVKVMSDEPDGGAPVHNNNFQQHPSMSDMLICYPTLQGYYAWRNREKGSWYIEAVVKIFMKYAKCEDLCAMLNRVNSSVSRKVSRTPQSTMDRMSQMSEYKSSLRNPYLFLFPGIGTPTLE